MIQDELLLPVGYHKFHKDQVYNFQLNRWYSLGYARLEDFQKVGSRIKNFTDWKNEMLKLAEDAVFEKRYINAAFYYRAAEFYILSKIPEKEKMYEKFSEYFYLAFKDDKIERFDIPYENTFLPAMKVNSMSGEKKGTIVMVGGFDSFIEEWYSMMRFFNSNLFV